MESLEQKLNAWTYELSTTARHGIAQSILEIEKLDMAFGVDAQCWLSIAPLGQLEYCRNYGDEIPLDGYRDGEALTVRLPEGILPGVLAKILFVNKSLVEHVVSAIGHRDWTALKYLPPSVKRALDLLKDELMDCAPWEYVEPLGVENFFALRPETKSAIPKFDTESAALAWILGSQPTVLLNHRLFTINIPNLLRSINQLQSSEKTVGVTNV